ncbi:PVC-type heme-binding CxxCH protein [Aquiflexum sp.]|uniref:PVC-type heme-binding CxxCH protein n=1 Tax=Aquiflexum sp. TaxID=1872584 RepID=UPI00359424D3
MKYFPLISAFILLIFFFTSCRHVSDSGSTSIQEQDSSVLYVPDGLEAHIWAESPLFHNPTNIDVDIRGRVWVTEAVNYRNFNNDSTTRLHHPKGDRIVILEDTNGDGKADASKVFVQDEDLIAPLGIAVIENKVYVSCAPNLIVYTDEDGDDIPDKKEIFLTGFGGLDHDHSLHSILAGPDGKLYFNTGNAGPHQVTDKSGWSLRSGSIYAGGSPYNKNNTPGLKSDDGNVWTGGLGLRINPDGTGLEVVGHNFRNAYELAVDSYGNMWQNDNDDEVQGCRTSWIMEKGNAGYASADGSRTWRADRRPGQSIPIAHWHQEDPGVFPAGDVTGAGSPTGVTVYEGDELGESFRGLLLSADAGRNVIFGYHPEAVGAGFKLKRTDFISSLRETTEDYIWNEKLTDTKKWFRPSDITSGTDGALYIADWYDPIVGGHVMDDTLGIGKIYRIIPKGKNLQAPKINLENTEGQILALLNPAVNVRYSGYTRLKDSGSKAMVQLQEVLQSENPYHIARALFLLAEFPEGVMEVVNSLSNENSQLKVAAVRALRNAGKLDDKILLKLSKDKSEVIRREVAIALYDKPFTGLYKAALINVAQSLDENDKAYIEAVGTGAKGKEAALYQSLLTINGKDPLKWSKPMAAITWRLHPESSIPELKKRAMAETLSEDERKQAITALGFIEDKDAATAMFELTKNALPDVSQQANWWLTYRKTNTWYHHEITGWKKPVDNLEKNSELVSLKDQLLLIGLPLEDKIKIAGKLAEDSPGSLILIGLAAQNKINDEVKNSVSEAILKNPDRTVQALGKRYFIYDEKETVSNEKILGNKGDPELGKILFISNCGYCHKVDGVGAETGPELTMVKNKYDEKRLLEAIVFPNKGVEFGYEPTIITTKDGAAVLGFVYTDGKIIVLKNQFGQMHTIDSENVDMKINLNASIMPDAQLLQLNEEKLSHIVKYLMTL